MKRRSALTLSTSAPAPTGPRLTHPTGTLTPRERDALDAIIRFIRRTGTGPTGREIADAVGVSTQRTYQLFQELRKNGWIAYQGHSIVEAAEPWD